MFVCIFLLSTNKISSWTLKSWSIMSEILDCIHGSAKIDFLWLSYSFCFVPKPKQLILVFDLLQNSVNARYQTIPYPWLVFGEKVKVNTVFLRDSTGVSDSILILFGGALQQGSQVIFLLAYKPTFYSRNLVLAWIHFVFCF